ncbi:MAG: GWxTD domain-containing protein [Bacteroidales bacterium]|nr:GWxTD domain-containing protein [Bacteroidales bacterium]
MKRLFIISLMVLVGITVNAQQQKALNSYISYATFDNPGENTTPYIETYITFDKSSLIYTKGANGEFNATVNITIMFKQGESVKNFGKYSLSSPSVADTTAISGFFLDMQRYSLDNGNYTMEVTLEDENNKDVSPFKVEEQFVVDYPNRFSISNIIGLESYSKATEGSSTARHGYEIIPMMMPFYPESINKLSFYAEIYNAKKQLGENEKYLLNTYICTFESDTKLNNFYFTKRMSAKDIDVIINNMDITNLPSGNYYLVLEARDRNNEVIGLNRYFFQRSNPYYQVDESIMANIDISSVFTGKINNIDTIREYIRTINPISTMVEKEYAQELIRTADITTMQQYFYTFWASRNKVTPEQAWLDYYAQVLRVNASFNSVNSKGYDTDRGIVFLKYGAPDRIVQSYNEPGAYPYEIWHYYTLGSQRNKKFVFMTLDLATNDFQLIHSDAIGEINNFRWTTEIYQRTYGTYFDYGVDGAASPESYGDKAKDYYDLPR